jgi:hypothetical protein
MRSFAGHLCGSEKQTSAARDPHGRSARYLTTDACYLILVMVAGTYAVALHVVIVARISSGQPCFLPALIARLTPQALVPADVAGPYFQTAIAAHVP